MTGIERHWKEIEDAERGVKLARIRALYLEASVLSRELGQYEIRGAQGFQNAAEMQNSAPGRWFEVLAALES